MAKRLSRNLNSDYIAAMNRLDGKHRRRRIIAYVESFDDVSFWRNLLQPLESEHYYFEIMLPSRSSLRKGKKTVLQNELGPQLGKYMIACVDADYDYALQGATLTSRILCTNPYVFHTYVYAIENYQCYAPSLHAACVMATLNDHHLFDFEAFLTDYSRAIYPLFVWNIWCYRTGYYPQFSMLDFYHIVMLTRLDYFHPERTIVALRRRVNAKIARLQQQFPEAKSTYKPLSEELERLGLDEDHTYLYMRGHDLFEGVVAPLLQGICDTLRKEREREIHRLAVHYTQEQNELAGYRHSILPIEDVLRRQAGYTTCPVYLRVQADVRRFLQSITPTPLQPAEAQSAPTAADLPPSGNQSDKS